jgi:hypothetical protein
MTQVQHIVAQRKMMHLFRELPSKWQSAANRRKQVANVPYPSGMPAPISLEKV